MRSRSTAPHTQSHTKSCLLLAATLAAFGVPPSIAAAQRLTAGTNVEVRLSVPTGSRISHPGDPVQATVIAPIVSDGEVLVPQGAVLAGTVESVDRLGMGIKHLTSSITYRFDTIEFQSGEAVPIQAKVVQVETAKEHVDAKGNISGIYPTVNFSSSLVSSVIPLLCVDPHFGLPFMGVKVLVARSPDPEIFYPAGTELILALTEDIDIPAGNAPLDTIRALSSADMAAAHTIVSRLPEQRSSKGHNQPSDLVNILFLGSRDSIDRAFRAAGWQGAQRHSPLSLFRVYRSIVQRIGYSAGPMARLTLNGAAPAAEYQKGLNTFSKRHHARLWKQEDADTWLGAATEDVDYTMHNLHLTHATDNDIDNERSKVLNDIAFTGCVSSAGLLPRMIFGADTDSIVTDGGVAILRMNDCRHPFLMPSPAGGSGQRPHSIQALIALRNDLLRANPVSLAYNTAKLVSPNRRKEPAIAIAPPLHWDRPSMLDAAEFRSPVALHTQLSENGPRLQLAPVVFPSSLLK